MSNELSSSNNDLLKSLGSTVMKDSWLQGQYSANRAEQQEELKRIFTVIAENNVSDSERKALEKRAKSLKQKIDRMEDKLESLKGEIKESEEEIEKHANEIANLVTKVEAKSAKMENDNQKYVKNCISDVFHMYETGKIGKDKISPEIRARVKSGSAKIQAAANIEAIIGALESKKTEISGLVEKASGWIDKKNTLQSQYGVTKSAYSLINANLKQIGNTSTDYRNSDTDTNIPVYSLEKTDIASDLFENPAYNVKAKNTAYIEGSNEKDAPLTDATTTTSNSTRQLSSTRNGDNIVTTTEVTTTTTTIGYKKDTWSKDIGNTINSNPQIKALSENYVDIINKLAKGEPKFSFKEGMYILFDKKAGLFKDSNVSYDATKLDNGNPTYTIAPCGDKASADFYKNLSDKIYEAWGVSLSSASYKNIQGIVNTSTTVDKKTDTVYSPIEREENTDPITFRKGNTEYAFLIDRDNDDSFSALSEFIGAKSGKTWLDDLKSLDLDNDGKLNKEELKNLKVLASTYKDNAEVKFDDGYLRDTKTNIKYYLTNAQALGIEEIDLAGLENNVNKSTGKFDINGSEIFNDSFSFKINGEEITASRKDDTKSFMNVVYKDAVGKGFHIGLSEEQASSIIASSYAKLDEEMNGFESTFANVNTLLGLSDTIKETKNMFNEALDRTNRDESVQLTRATNRANALSNNIKDWTTVQREVRQIAQKLDIMVEMDQIKGIYAADGSLTAQEIVDIYTEQRKQYDEVQAGKEASKEAWSAIVECSKNGIKASSSKIMELLCSGKAKNAQEVVEILKKENNNQ